MTKRIVSFLVILAVALALGGAGSAIIRSFRHPAERQVTDDKWLQSYPEVTRDTSDDPNNWLSKYPKVADPAGSKPWLKDPIVGKSAIPKDCNEPTAPWKCDPSAQSKKSN
jgi:hypothetical protein